MSFNTKFRASADASAIVQELHATFLHCSDVARISHHSCHYTMAKFYPSQPSSVDESVMWARAYKLYVRIRSQESITFSADQLVQTGRLLRQRHIQGTEWSDELACKAGFLAWLDETEGAAILHDLCLAVCEPHDSRRRLERIQTAGLQVSMLEKGQVDHTLAEVSLRRMAYLQCLWGVELDDVIFNGLSTVITASTHTVSQLGSLDPNVDALVALSYRHRGDSRITDAEILKAAKVALQVYDVKTVQVWIDKFVVKTVKWLEWVNYGLVPYAVFPVVAVDRNDEENGNRLWIHAERAMVEDEWSVKQCGTINVMVDKEFSPASMRGPFERLGASARSIEENEDRLEVTFASDKRIITKWARDLILHGGPLVSSYKVTDALPKHEPSPRDRSPAVNRHAHLLQSAYETENILDALISWQIPSDFEWKSTSSGEQWDGIVTLMGGASGGKKRRDSYHDMVEKRICVSYNARGDMAALRMTNYRMHELCWLAVLDISKERFNNAYVVAWKRIGSEEQIMVDCGELGAHELYRSRLIMARLMDEEFINIEGVGRHYRPTMDQLRWSRRVSRE